MLDTYPTRSERELYDIAPDKLWEEEPDRERDLRDQEWCDLELTRGYER